MDFLIEKLHVLAITKNVESFNQSVDQLMSLDFSKATITETDPDHEWEILKRNYSNLKYIKELLNHYDYKLSDNFYTLLSNFLALIDRTTQHYIKMISWNEDEELKISFDEIKENFDNSLNQNDFNKKVKMVLDAYKILVPIVEDFRREKCNEVVDDEFRNLFSPKRLKRG